MAFHEELAEIRKAVFDILHIVTTAHGPDGGYGSDKPSFTEAELARDILLTKLQVTKHSTVELVKLSKELARAFFHPETTTETEEEG